MYHNYLDTLFKSLKKTEFYFKEHSFSLEDREKAFEVLVKSFSDAKKTQKQIFFIGNGGSAAIASHMTADFMKNGGMRTYSLYDNAMTTCMGNDYGYEYVFSKPLSFLGNQEDLLVAISSSGNSKNIVNAIEIAKKKEMKVITFTGFKCDNQVKNLGDYNVYVPICHYGIAESIHNLLLQQVVDTILERDGMQL